MVRAPPRVLPWSLAPSGVLGRGRFGPGSPLLGLVLWGRRKGVPGGGAFHCCEGRLGSGAPPPHRPPTGRAVGVRYPRAVGAGVPGLGALHCPLGLHALWGLRAAGRVSGFCVPGGGLGWGGGGGGAPCPPFVQPGGACRAGGRSASFRPSAFPRQATKRVSLASVCPWGALPPIPLRFMLARLHWARYVRRPGALARARLFPSVPAGAGGWGWGAGRALAPLSGGGRGDHTPGLGGWGPGPPRLAVQWGGWGGVATRPPCSPSGWRPAVPHPGPPRVVSALSSGVRVRAGSQGRPWVGGDEGRPVDRSPGGPCRPEPPLCPP